MTLRAFLRIQEAKEIEPIEKYEVLDTYREFGDLFSGKLPIGIPEHSR